MCVARAKTDQKVFLSVPHTVKAWHEQQASSQMKRRATQHEQEMTTQARIKLVLYAVIGTANDE